MARVEFKLSRNKVKSAGKLLRKQQQQPMRFQVSEVAEAIDILDHWRACHSYPLQKATMGLRSRCRTEGCHDARVSQRLKRRPTIVDKLAREPRMQLTTMHDIAGCRAVLADLDEVRRVQRRWTRRKERVVRLYDYITDPKPTGYRGVHLVVQYDGFLIEVQLRTLLQHAWGVAVERVGPMLGHDLKSGHGPPEVLELFRYFGGLLGAADEQDTTAFDWAGFFRAVDGVHPRVLKLVGLEVAEDGSVTLSLPDGM